MKYTNLLPFMDSDELKKIADEIISGELKGIKLQALFPFLGRENLHNIVDQLIEKKDVTTLQSAIPFISREKVIDIYNAAENGDLPDFDSSRCIPFLGSEKIKEIFRELVKKESSEFAEEDDE
ncbi:MAG: hypothetical protein WC479_06750 [Candidatus Izemoplasmatales bacterium]|jgi:hypothetical protein|nr:hypothetical protein [Candidatus Izemoplasmatales bacterium]MDD3865971.1 hypothetical protein [Candidatus Izemoplasmatales bacterium]